MLRFSMKSEEDAPEDWQARLVQLGIQITKGASHWGATVYYATMGQDNLVLEQATGRSIATWLAYPTPGQSDMANALVQCGAAQLDCCHLMVSRVN
ncbi:hypothetical protein [Ottowia sp.]|uniref:hypothetical protein n=1 Tax=Ottowia sp. TaxID=1898956 RepID=UPI0025EC9B59|nr:hypothetical protein [Ottowia sp.]MBK6616396.1 hypothetical protein [Ottowia sp.]